MRLPALERIAALSLPLLILCVAAQARTSATNFSTDIVGVVDTRSGTWGTAGAQTWHITFRPPAGQRVQILRVYGDVVAWPKGHPQDGTRSGVLFGLQTTAAEGSTAADWAADNCFLYLQDVLGVHGSRTPFDIRLEEVYLEADHIMVVKVASWLNDTGLAIHIEPTFSMVYQFVPAPEAPSAAVDKTAASGSTVTGSIRIQQIAPSK
jgi:hypothetical protein